MKHARIINSGPFNRLSATFARRYNLILFLSIGLIVGTYIFNNVVFAGCCQYYSPSFHCTGSSSSTSCTSGGGTYYSSACCLLGYTCGSCSTTTTINCAGVGQDCSIMICCPGSICDDTDHICVSVTATTTSTTTTSTTTTTIIPGAASTTTTTTPQQLICNQYPPINLIIEPNPVTAGSQIIATASSTYAYAWVSDYMDWGGGASGGPLDFQSCQSTQPYKWCYSGTATNIPGTYTAKFVGNICDPPCQECEKTAQFTVIASVTSTTTSSTTTSSTTSTTLSTTTTTIPTPCFYDQKQETFNSEWGSAEGMFGQSFTPSTSGQVDFIDICLSTQSTHLIEIREGENIDGNLLASSTESINTDECCGFPIGDCSGGLTRWFRFKFDPSVVLLTKDNIYTIKIISGWHTFVLNNLNSYQSGKAYLQSGFSSNSDMMFKTHMCPISQTILTCDNDEINVGEKNKCRITECENGLWIIINKEGYPLNILTYNPVVNIPPNEIEFGPAVEEGKILTRAICFDPFDYKNPTKTHETRVVDGTTTTSTTIPGLTTTTTIPLTTTTVTGYNFKVELRGDYDQPYENSTISIEGDRVGGACASSCSLCEWNTGLTKIINIDHYCENDGYLGVTFADSSGVSSNCNAEHKACIYYDNNWHCCEKECDENGCTNTVMFNCDNWKCVGVSDFHIREVDCNEDECEINIDRNAYDKTFDIVLHLVKEPEGIIYYSGDSTISEGFTGTKTISIDPKKVCPSDTDLKVIIDVYDDSENRIYHLKEDAFIC